MIEQRDTIDDAIVDLAYYYLDNAVYLASTMDRTVSRLMLDEDLTKEQKRALKEDARFNSRVIMLLGQARDAYRRMHTLTDELEMEWNGRIGEHLYDKGQAIGADLMSVDLVYLMLYIIDEASREKIHDFLKTLEWPEDLKTTYAAIQRRRARMLTSDARNMR